MIRRLWNRFWSRRDYERDAAIYLALIADGKRRHARTDYIEAAHRALTTERLRVGR